MDRFQFHCFASILGPDVVSILQRHPDAPTVARRQGKCVLPAQPQRLKHDDLAREVGRGEHMREQAQLVQHGIVHAVCAVDADDTGEDGVNAKEAGGERSDLVDTRGLVFEARGGGPGDGLELADGVGAGGGVRHEETVVDAARVVESDEVLDGIAYCCDRDLELGECVSRSIVRYAFFWGGEGGRGGLQSTGEESVLPPGDSREAGRYPRRGAGRIDCPWSLVVKLSSEAWIGPWLKFAQLKQHALRLQMIDRA